MRSRTGAVRARKHRGPKKGDSGDKFAEILNNLEGTDPLFINEGAGDYRLRGDSPALAIPGFADITFQQMGIVDEALIFKDDFERGDASAWLQ